MGYEGDFIINSMGDIAWIDGRFLSASPACLEGDAWRLPWIFEAFYRLY